MGSVGAVGGRACVGRGHRQDEEHVGGAAGYPNEVKQSDSIIKLLELLPEADRKWIKIDQPHINTFYNVLRQILEYVEKESSLKLSIEAIQKESSTKPGTIEVNQVADSSGGKPSDGSSGGG